MRSAEFWCSRHPFLTVAPPFSYTVTCWVRWLYLHPRVSDCADGTGFSVRVAPFPSLLGRTSTRTVRINGYRNSTVVANLLLFSGLLPTAACGRALARAFALRAGTLPLLQIALLRVLP